MSKAPWSRGLWSGVVRATLALAVVSGGAMIALPEAQADSGDLAIGTRLRAVENVQLHQASIAKGSKVNVTRLVRERGRLSGVDLELADGHVVPKVDVGTVRSFFQVVED